MSAAKDGELKIGELEYCNSLGQRCGNQVVGIFQVTETQPAELKRSHILDLEPLDCREEKDASLGSHIRKKRRYLCNVASSVAPLIPSVSIDKYKPQLDRKGEALEPQTVATGLTTRVDGLPISLVILLLIIWSNSGIVMIALPLLTGALDYVSFPTSSSGASDTLLRASAMLGQCPLFLQLAHAVAGPTCVLLVSSLLLLFSSGNLISLITLRYRKPHDLHVPSFFVLSLCQGGTGVALAGHWAILRAMPPPISYMLCLACRMSAHLLALMAVCVSKSAPLFRYLLISDSPKASMLWVIFVLVSFLIVKSFSSPILTVSNSTSSSQKVGNCEKAMNKNEVAVYHQSTLFSASMGFSVSSPLVWVFTALLGLLFGIRDYRVVSMPAIQRYLKTPMTVADCYSILILGDLLGQYVIPIIFESLFGYYFTRLDLAVIATVFPTIVNLIILLKMLTPKVTAILFATQSVSHGIIMAMIISSTNSFIDASCIDVVYIMSQLVGIAVMLMIDYAFEKVSPDIGVQLHSFCVLVIIILTFIVWLKSKKYKPDYDGAILTPILRRSTSRAPLSLMCPIWYYPKLILKNETPIKTREA